MIIGHTKQLEFLRNSLKKGRAGHAYLFSGPAKVGKKTVALAWLSEILNKEIPAGILKKDDHPDIILVNPQEDEIKISQIRDLIWKLSLKPYSSDFKAAVIDDAHLMNIEAQNAFLKTLEEPKGNVFIFLVTDQPESLLPTIVSRVQTVKFYPVAGEKIKNFLENKKIAGGITEEIFQISSGRPGTAIDFISDPLKLDFFRKALGEIKKISESDLFFRFQCAKSVSEDARQLKNDLDIWLGYFRSILLLEAGRESSRRKHALLKLKNIIDNIQTTKMLISRTNVNPKLALESIMLDF